MQAAQTTTRIAIIIIFLLLCVGSVQPAQAQISPDRLRHLKQKYGQWGSIYLSYGTIPDVIQVLENRNRLEFIRTKFAAVPPAEFISFFYVNREPSQRKSVTMFQINFETKVAGYLMNSNHDGTITRVPMGPGAVLRAADWCDHYLTNRQEIFRIAALLERNQIPLAEGWKAILAAYSNPFSTEGSIASLLTQYRVVMIYRAAELNALGTDNPKLFKTLILFANQYDYTTRKYIYEYFSPTQSLKDNPKEVAIPNPGVSKEFLDYEFKHYLLPKLKLEAERNDLDVARNKSIEKLKLEIYKGFSSRSGNPN